MRKILASILLSAGLAIAGPAVADPDWLAANKRSAAYAEQGDLKKAVEEAKKAYELFAKSDRFQPMAYATLVLNYVDLELERDNMADARRGLASAMRKLEPRDEASTAALIQMKLAEAQLLQMYGEFREMIAAYTAAIGTAREGFGETDPRVAELWLRHADAIKELKGFNAGLRSLQAAEQIMANHPADHPLAVLTRMESAKIQVEAGQMKKGEAQYRDILDWARSSGKDMRAVETMALAKLVYIASESGREAEANAMIDEIIALADPNGEAEELYVVTPRVPNYAEDSVLMVEYDVSEEGYAVNPRVVVASGHSQWEAEVLRAVTKWRYKPKLQEGEPMPSYNHRHRFTLNIDRYAPTGSLIRR